MHPVSRPRPSFARDFPRNETIDALVDAFVRGNYALVRSEARKVVDSSDAEEVRIAARVLLERTTADPVAVRLLWITAALLVGLTTYWAVNGKAPSPEQRHDHHPSQEPIP